MVLNHQIGVRFPVPLPAFAHWSCRRSLGFGLAGQRLLSCEGERYALLDSSSELDAERAVVVVQRGVVDPEKQLAGLGHPDGCLRSDAERLAVANAADQ